MVECHSQLKKKKKRKKENPKGENKIFILDFSSSHL